jgi:RNA polymerase sigma-70 factor (ECF subfamily)
MTHAAIDYAELDERALVAHASAGDHEAFRAIMQRFNQRLFRVARAVAGSDAEAEDALQDAYLNAFRAIGSFRHEASLLTWLTSITLNEARARLRKRREPVDLAAVDQAGADIIPFPGMTMPIDPESEASRAEARKLVETAMAALPEDFRIVFVLKEIEGCSIEETATQLGLNPQTVKTRLHRARRLLRHDLEERLSQGLEGLYPFLGERCARMSDRVLAKLFAAP